VKVWNIKHDSSSVRREIGLFITLSVLCWRESGFNISIARMHLNALCVCVCVACLHIITINLNQPVKRYDGTSKRVSLRALKVWLMAPDGETIAPNRSPALRSSRRWHSYCDLMSSGGRERQRWSRVEPICTSMAASAEKKKMATKVDVDVEGGDKLEGAWSRRGSPCLIKVTLVFAIRANRNSRPGKVE